MKTEIKLLSYLLLQFCSCQALSNIQKTSMGQAKKKNKHKYFNNGKKYLRNKERGR